MIASLRRKLSALWRSTQVELQGTYSVERVQALYAYSKRQSGLRIFVIPLITPLPSLILVTIIDLIPLRPPTEGIQANQLFFVRTFATFWIATTMTYTQFKHFVDRMPLSVFQIVIISALVAASTVGVMYALALAVGFPLPFSSIAVSPVWLFFIILPLISWIKQVRVDNTAWLAVVNTLKVMACQEVLAVIYPTYLYVFTTIPERWKTVFALLLPILKLVLRLAMAKTVAHLSDEIPEIVIVNVEVFSALFVAYCMQNTPSVETTCILMAVDALQMSASLLDVGSAARRLKSITRQNCAKLLTVQKQSERPEAADKQDIFNRQISSHFTSSNIRQPVPKAILKMTSAVQPSSSITDKRQAHENTTQQARFVLFEPLQSVTCCNGRCQSTLLKVPKRSIEAQYMEELRKVLYITEFVILFNYVEVVIPLIFAMYLFTMYHLPNRIYYEQMINMDNAQLRRTLLNLLLYSGLQLLSLIILNMVLWHKMRFSGLRQLAFVLERQCSRVQNRLTFWVYYNVQSSLAHCGYDYTFKFAWLWKKPS